MIFARFSLAASLAAMSIHTAMASDGVFSYDPYNDYGPSHWADLEIDGNECNGQKNSPIAVTTSACNKFGDYKFANGSCGSSYLSYTLTPTSVKASYPSDGSCEIPTVQIPGVDGTYQALQFHIHTSSEHTIDGSKFGAELHIVHQQVDGDRLAVVGMMIQPDASEENSAFETLLEGWSYVFESNESYCSGNANGDRKLQDDKHAPASRRHLDSVFAPYNLIPEGATFYHYDGGLTTPPCSEVVWWNLADRLVSITPSQYSRLTTQILSYTDVDTCGYGTFAGSAGSTSRPVQPLNGRTVTRICPVGFKDSMSSSISSRDMLVAFGAAMVAAMGTAVIMHRHNQKAGRLAMRSVSLL